MVPKEVLIFWLILFMVFTVSDPSNIAAKRIPAPMIKAEQDIKISKNSEFSIHGEGFIKNFPSAHRVYIEPLLTHGKIHQQKLNVVYSAANGLVLQIPADIDYGDYSIHLQLRTKFLKSTDQALPMTLMIRPEAPPKAELRHSVISDTNELKNLVTNSDFESKTLSIGLLGQEGADNGALALGLNRLVLSYEDAGFKSLLSEAAEFFYLPHNFVEDPLYIQSEIPIKAYALSNSLLEYQQDIPVSWLQDLMTANGSRSGFDISDIVKHEDRDLQKSFYLTTPSIPKYLERIITLSPVYISKLHVTADEYAVLTNRSQEDFHLSSCSLADSLKIRYFFGNSEIIPAQSSLQINANLGLNDSSPDALIFACSDSEKNSVLIDRFDYNATDEDGFAKR